MNREYMETNRGLWNGWAKIHVKTAFYDVDAFKAGKSSLMPVELGEMGDVSGKSLLHLQCHFGLDTMSWAREGATVTGVDFSEDAVNLARSLSQELGIEAEFICSNIYDLPQVLDKQYDIVFTSYGALEWLPDLTTWGEIVANRLKPGGKFYAVEFHPTFWLVDDETGQRVAYDYFPGDEPESGEEQGSYANPNADFTHMSHVWPHGIGEIVTSLSSAGLRVEFLHEFPYSVYNIHAAFEEKEAGQYGFKDSEVKFPLMFSIQARR